MSASLNDLLLEHYGSGNLQDAMYAYFANGALSPTQINEPRVPLTAGYYYGFRSSYGGTMSTLAVTAGLLYALPFYLPEDASVDRIALNITTQGAAATAMRLGIYEAGADGLPGALLVDGGALLTDTTGIKEATIAQELATGTLYYLAALFSGTPTVTIVSPVQPVVGNPTASDTNARCGYSVAAAYGALPASWGTPSAYLAFAPHVVVRVV